MASVESWRVIETAEIAPHSEQWWFWDYDARNFDPTGYLIAANAVPELWHINESFEVIGGAVEVFEVFWLRKGDNVQGFGNLQLNIKVRNLGDWCRYDLWTAAIPPHSGQ